MHLAGFVRLYAILRNEVYRRTKKRGRQLPTDFSAMGAPEICVPAKAGPVEFEALDIKFGCCIFECIG